MEDIMEILKVNIRDNIINERNNMDFELVESEAVDATVNIMGSPGGSIMEGAFFVYKFS